MPVAVLVLYQISVTDTLYYVRCFVAVSEYGVVVACDILAPYIVRYGICNHMTVFCAALCRHKIISSVYLINVGAFKITSARTFPDRLAVGELFARSNVNLALYNAALAVVVLSVAYEECSAVLKVQRRVDTALIDFDRV